MLFAASAPKVFKSFVTARSGGLLVLARCVLKNECGTNFLVVLFALG